MTKENLLEFIKKNSDNSAQQLKRIHLELYTEINNLYDYPKFSQKVYDYIYGEQSGKCIVCGKKCTFLSFNKGYSNTCSRKCRDVIRYTNSHDIRTCVICGTEFEIRHTREKRTCSEKCALILSKSPEVMHQRMATLQSTCLEKYGVPHYSMTDKFKTDIRETHASGQVNYIESEKKSRQTRLMRYGDANYTNPLKNKATCMERYGVENTSQLESTKQKVTDTHMKRYGVKRAQQSPEIRERTMKTMVDRYGGCGWGSVELNDRMKITNMERYGTIYPMQNDDVQNKAKATSLERYGVEHFTNYPKASKTNILKYGVPNTYMIDGNKSNGKRISSGQRKLHETLVEQYPDAILEHYLSDVDKSVDIFIPSQNKIIEYFGDYWHCNPKNYLPDFYHPNCKKIASEIWKNDAVRVKNFENAGYTVEIVWENSSKHHI